MCYALGQVLDYGPSNAILVTSFCVGGGQWEILAHVINVAISDKVLILEIAI